MSVTVITISAHISTNRKNNFKLIPKVKTAVTNSKPVASSTKGYCILIDSLQYLHLALSKNTYNWNIIIPG